MSVAGIVTMRQRPPTVKGVLFGRLDESGFVQRVWALDGMLGGYEGHPSYTGGQDRRAVEIRG